MREGKGDPAIAVIVAALCVASAVLLVDGAQGEELATQLLNGFAATHAAGASALFEPVLCTPNGVFAFGFLRVGSASLDLAVVHLPSSFPLWRATPARLGDWSRPATLTFDSSLMLTDPDHGVLWQTLNTNGDTVVLLNSSNLVVRRYAKPMPAWQSFDNPSDTLVLDQNFTVSSPPLISKNRRFALRLGKTFMALHMEFYGGRATLPTTPMYWQHTALKAQPENATQPPVYGRLDDRGFFGLYLEGSGQRVDVLSFDTFAQNITGVFQRLTLDDDGNLRAYYWTDGSKAWTSDYKAISEQCELPITCGAYGLCIPGEPQCQCLTNSKSTSPPCHAEETTDLCSANGGWQQLDFDVVRRKRVSVAYKEELPFETNKTAAECELACAANCSCWGALYNGASGYCYLIDFPVETLVYEADDRKVGYFKARKRPSPARPGMSPGVTAATAVLSLVLASLAAAGVYIGDRVWERKRRRRAGMEQELAPGPYKDLKSMGSSNKSFRA
ncbi:PAN domain-containing protein At5g03700-like [Phragmites australis]|uniref:PAN domain-containing protein At5g03700-like n=1 Tax=Phragmites australis TaxID=29695 RepID=UPI002D78A192|nr:PAN domain-containing protein At5g03700-like [Phragmites australis]